MNQNEEYIELDLKALFFYILRQWKKIIVFAVVFAILLGAYQAYNEYAVGILMEEDSEYWGELQQYEDQLALYENRVTVTEEKIESLQDYMDHSVLMDADYRNMHVAKAAYYIDSGYQIMPDKTYQDPNKTSTLTWYYQTYLSDYSVYEEIAAEMDMEAKYLMELVDVYTSNGETLDITVKHPYSRSAKNIMRILQEKLSEVHDFLNRDICEHTLTLMMNTCGTYVDDALKEAQQAANDEMLENQNDLLEYKQELYRLEEDGGPGDLNIVKAFIKWFVIGGVLGGVLAVGFYGVLSILKNQVYGRTQLLASYQLPVFGEIIAEGKSPNLISRMLDKMEGRITVNSEENLQFLAANIQYHCGDMKNILVSTDVDEETAREIADSLSKYLPEIQLIPAGNLLKDADSLHKLRDCQAVMMLVFRDQTKNKTLWDTLRLVREGGKAAAGFVFVH